MTAVDPIARADPAAPRASAPVHLVDAWTELIARLSSGTGSVEHVDAVLAAAVDLLPADGAAVLRWVGGRSHTLGSRGLMPLPIEIRLAEGPGTIGSAAVAVATLDPRTDIVVARQGGPGFESADVATLGALGALVRWTISGGETRLRLLSGFTTRVAASLDPEEVLSGTADAAANLARADIAGVFTPDATGDFLQMRAMVGNTRRATARLTLRRGEGMGGLVYATGEAQRVDDYGTDPRSSPGLLALSDVEGTCSAIGVPMRREGGVEGVLCLWRRRREAFTDADEALLLALGELCARQLNNARTHAELGAHLAQQQASAADARDELTLACAERDRLRGQVDRAAIAARLQEALNRVARESGDLTSVLRTVGSMAAVSAAVIDTDGRMQEWDALAAPRRLGSHLQAWLSTVELPVAPDDVAVVELAGGWMLVAPVRAVGITLGHLALGVASEPDAAQRLAAQHTALAAAALLSRQEATVTALRRAQSEFVWDLLDGRLPDDVATALGAQHLGPGFSLPARVIALSVPLRQRVAGEGAVMPDQLARSRTAIGRLVTSALGAVGRQQPVVASRADMFAMLMPVNGRDDAADRALLVTALGAIPWPVGVIPTVGVGGRVDRVARFGEGWNEARLAASAAAPGSPVAFEDLGVLQFLLAPTSRGDLDAFAHRTIGPLVRYDAENGTELVATLSAYLDSDCNARQTAQALFVHHRTVTYRLGRIDEVAGVRLRSTKDLFELQLALKILGLHQAAPGSGRQHG